MKQMLAVIALIGSALAGCGSDPAPAPQPTTNAEQTAARVEQLAEGQRNAVFLRAIRDSRGECQHVDSSARGGTYHGEAVWTARCDGGHDFTLVIGADETVGVLDAAERRLIVDPPR